MTRGQAGQAGGEEMLVVAEDDVDESLDFITSLIEDHSVFHNEDGPTQASPKHQLMLLLYYMGHEGENSSQMRKAFRMGYGTCYDFCRRAKEAILSLKDEYIGWPVPDEREEITNRMKENFDCPNCVGVFDGKLIELAIKPQREDFADYHGRKFDWSITMLLIGDDQRFVRYYMLGFPGSAHDNRVNMEVDPVYRNPEEFFSELQYLIGDSAFTASAYVVSSYRADHGGIVSDPQKQNCNEKIEKPRNISEHINGMLAGRFPGVFRKIRMLLNKDPKSMREIIEILTKKISTNGTIHAMT